MTCRLRPETLFKKRLRHKCFPVNFFEISKNRFSLEHLHFLLLLAILIFFFDCFYSDMREIFKQFDINGNGSIDSKELKAYLDSLNIETTPKSLETLFTAMDKDGL